MNNKLIKYSFVASIILLGTANVTAASPMLDKIKSTGVVTMGVRESSIPMSYTTGDSRFDGYHVEICRMILADIKANLGLNTLRINYQPVTSQNRVPLVQNGTVDIECGTTTNNTARAKDVGFANTLYVEEVRIAVKANSGITSIAQLNGKKLLPLLVQLRFSYCAKMKKRLALILMKCLVRTTQIAFCCWSLVVPMHL